MGAIGEDNLALRMHQLKMQLRMIINTILDIRVHCREMSEADAMDLMARCSRTVHRRYVTCVCCSACELTNDDSYPDLAVAVLLAQHADPDGLQLLHRRVSPCRVQEVTGV